MNDRSSSDFLILHTSDATGTVAVSRGERLAVQVLDAAAHHARSVLGAVEAALAELDLRLADLQGLIVTLGPGSFTGIRIGLATAQGLAAARHWSVLTCDSLMAEAAAFQGEQVPVAIALDARRNEVYAALYDVRSPRPLELLPPFCAVPAAAATRLAQSASTHASKTGRAEIALSGSGGALLRPVLAPGSVHSQHLQAAARKEVARALLRLGRSGACAKMKPEELEPLYLRKSDAEIRRQDSASEA